jgi:hypothetical protein
MFSEYSFSPVPYDGILLHGIEGAKLVNRGEVVIYIFG